MTPESFSTISTVDKIQYSEANISVNALIIRDKETKSASLILDSIGEWSLFAGTSVKSIDYSAPIAKGSTGGTFFLNIPHSVRYYFKLITPKGEIVLSEQHLPMTGGYNFRDLGGYKTKEGFYVKWGKIFRSDDLHNLTDNDLSYLSSIPLVSIVDFRSDKEMELAPDKNPVSVKRNYPFSISPGNLMGSISSIDDLHKLTLDEADALMQEMNVLLVTDKACINRYRDLFELLQNEENLPLMFHCSAGKDRTGMGAALVLLALGLDEETVLKDYLLSNIYLSDKYIEYKNVSPALKSLFEVKSEFLQAGLNKIKEDYNSVENYLISVLNVDIERMRQMYLYE